MNANQNAAESFDNLVIVASTKTGNVRLHLAGCTAIKPSRTMRTASTNVAAHVADARNSGHKVERCECCK